MNIGIDPNREADCLAAFVHNGNCAVCFMDSLLGCFAEDQRRVVQDGKKRRLVEYHGAQGPYIHDNRSRVVRYFLEMTDHQWLWFLDNDMDFPVDTLYRLLDAAEKHDCKILGAAYWNQYGPSGRFLSWLLFSQHGIRAMNDLPDTDEPIELTATGMGCTLIHRSVLQDVVDMYPNDPWDSFAADVMVRFADGGFLIGRTPEEIMQAPGFHDRTVVESQRMGEDVTFLLRARRAGHITYGLPSLTVDHYKQGYMEHSPRESMSSVGT